MKQIVTITNGNVTSPAGFEASAVAAGVKYQDRLDLTLLVSQQPCTAAALFTQNQVAAAPVLVDRETIATNASSIRAVVANAGSANACTGQPGLANARAMQQMTAEAIQCQPDQVLVLSTGVIGVQLPMDKVKAGIAAASQQLSPDGGPSAARAIMTTDTRAKELAVQVQLPAGVITIGGMAKGSGMIHPNMATMLGVITTDAAVDAETLDSLLRTAVNASFNRISVDGDTSTNDTVMLLANGASGIEMAGSESIGLFSEALSFVCIQLAKMIIRDGEGATKFVTIRVRGGGSEADAHAVAMTIATSPLVKTAFAGSDPNWGRILAAAGRAGIPFDQSRTGLWIGLSEPCDLQLVAHGTPTDYQEADAAAVFSQESFMIELDLGAGDGQVTVWTTDLTHDYISINADYRS